MESLARPQPAPSPLKAAALGALFLLACFVLAFAVVAHAAARRHADGVPDLPGCDRARCACRHAPAAPTGRVGPRLGVFPGGRGDESAATGLTVPSPPRVGAR